MNINSLTEADLTKEGADILERATLRMLFSKSDATFFAYLLVKMQVVREAHPPQSLGMGIYIHDGIFTLTFDADRVKEHKIDDIDSIVWILGHESMHWVLNHHYRERDYWGQDEDKIIEWHPLFNIAEDLEIHEHYIPIPTMADMVCVVGKGPFKDFPKEGTAEEYFELLKKEAGNQPPPPPINPGGDGKDGDPSTDGKDGQQGQGKSSGKGRMKIEINGTDVTITDTVTGKKWHFKVSDQGAPQRDAQEDLNKEVLRQQLAEALKEARPSMGTEPGGLVSIIEKFIQPPRIDWRHRFRQLIGKFVRFNWHGSWKRFSRRLGEGFRGRVKDHGLFIIVVPDTSGSVPDAFLAEFNNEMDNMRRIHKVRKLTVIECDAAVQNVYDLKEYGQINCTFKGRGGTDFRPAFEYIDALKMQPDMVIYLTDSQGTYPEAKPKYPVIWAVTTADALQKIPWGDVVLMDLDKTRTAPH